MAGWTRHEGKALLLLLDNVDTDQLIPARFMSVPRSQGYGPYLLHDLRRDADGALRGDFVLNDHADASVIVAGPNFGSGSSREAAVYTLIDAGVRAVFAPSFGDIFSSNAVNNGLLPARISAEDAAKLTKALTPGPCPVTVDLINCTISLGTQTCRFDLQDSWRTKLINGWDDIDLTLRHADTIRSYQETRHSTAPWAWPATAN